MGSECGYTAASKRRDVARSLAMTNEGTNPDHPTLLVVSDFI
jgi:hypothetical protein